MNTFNWSEMSKLIADYTALWGPAAVLSHLQEWAVRWKEEDAAA